MSGVTTPAARRALVEARGAIRGVLEHPRDAQAAAALDRVLDRGRIRLRADLAGHREEIEGEADWRVAWLAARDLVRLLDDHGPRVRNCGNPECILWFLDTTRSATRRWCSMAACGNRLKARRHYERRHAQSAERPAAP
jgi:predicted RNA-binding Zn ribbon-like protein